MAVRHTSRKLPDTETAVLIANVTNMNTRMCRNFQNGTAQLIDGNMPTSTSFTRFLFPRPLTVHNYKPRFYRQEIARHAQTRKLVRLLCIDYSLTILVVARMEHWLEWFQSQQRWFLQRPRYSAAEQSRPVMTVRYNVTWDSAVKGRCVQELRPVIEIQRKCKSPSLDRKWDESIINKLPGRTEIVVRNFSVCLKIVVKFLFLIDPWILCLYSVSF